MNIWPGRPEKSSAPVTTRTIRSSYKGVIDPVTEVDRASEDLLLGEINKRWPGSYILSEESGITQGDREQSWYVDPLDGTVNYAHGIPFFSVSIGLCLSGRHAPGRRL